MSLHIKTLLISFLAIAVGGIYFPVFSAQLNVSIPQGQTVVVSPEFGQYLYIHNKSSRTGFVPYTYKNGTSYGCPTTGQTRAIRNISNTAPRIITITTPWIVSGPASRGLDISCGCSNPDSYDAVDNESVPHLREGNLYNVETAPLGQTCAQHMAHIKCENGNILNQSNSNTGYIYPTCVEPQPVDCVLKRFLNNGISYSKIRNAVNGYINNQGTLGGAYGDRVLGYGTTIPIWHTSDGVAGGDFVAYSVDQYGPSIPLYEFELHGISLDTENINRGCLGNDGYRVNSNVYSIQQLKTQPSSTGLFFDRPWTTTRFGGITGVNFGLTYHYFYTDNQDKNLSNAIYINNRFFGCKSELLPNPDKYCVERVIPKDNSVSGGYPSAIYLKEFTNNYNDNTQIINYANRASACSNITGIGNLSFRLIQNSDLAGTGGLLDLIVPANIPGDGAPLAMGRSSFGDVLGSNNWNNTSFLYRNATGHFVEIYPGYSEYHEFTGSKYSTQMFGFYAYTGGNNQGAYYEYGYYNAISHDHVLETDPYYALPYYYNLIPSGDPKYYNIFGNPITSAHGFVIGLNGYNRDVSVGPGGMTAKSVVLPLAESNAFLFLESNDVNFPDEGRLIRYTGNAYGMMYSDGSTQLPSIYKYICISHTCNAGYHKTSAGCVWDGSTQLDQYGHAVVGTMN